MSQQPAGQDREEPGASPSAQLSPLDDLFIHQTTGFFGSVATSDLNWRERCWITGRDHAGETVFCIGLGNFPNKGVQDAFALVARHGRQETVRMSRALNGDPHVLELGPFGMEIIEPGKTLRLTMGENDSGISYDMVWDGCFRSHLQSHLMQRWRGRVLMDIDRFFQVGTLSGTLSVRGEEIALDEGWTGARDKSWGLRLTAEPGSAPSRPPELDFYLLLVARFPRYGVFCCTREPWTVLGGTHGEDANAETGGYMYPFDDPRLEERICAIKHEFDFDPAAPLGNFESGELSFILASGEERRLSVLPQPAGFHLRCGYGYEGWYQGEWKGMYHEEHSVLDLTDETAVRGAGFVTKAVTLRCGDEVGDGVIEFIPRTAHIAAIGETTGVVSGTSA